ncbi:hypothetical protein LCGC14_0146780 [marine sediment metagenome]|uniref:Uncharacterized protein n=1 Tax=marine sediment metagenome TaxID=412755 RepID=A0A0F9XHL4_9ZZZZ
MGTISQWDQYDKYVQGGLQDGLFMSGAFTLIAAGPPRLSNLAGELVVGTLIQAGGAAVDTVAYPIGVVQNLNISHNRQFTRLFEIGSERSYFISGRTIGQISLGRVLYHGPSLLRALYAYYQDLLPPGIVPSLWQNVGSAFVHHDVKIPPGYENLFINLASDMFSQPMGLLVYVKDSDERTVGAVYFEQCYVPNHTFATDAQGVLIQESCAIQFERAIPVATSEVALISGLL